MLRRRAGDEQAPGKIVDHHSEAIIAGGRCARHRRGLGELGNITSREVQK